MKDRKRYNIIFVHPDLGIGGAERLILDAALALQARGHKITIYTSHRDKSHCFEEARDGTLDVRVHGDKLFPAHIRGRFHVLMAILRQLSLIYYLSESTSTANNNDDEMHDIFIVDQVPACVPVLRALRDLAARRKTQKQRTLFYCHFPDQLLARRGEGGMALRALKLLYRYPFDWFEGWAMSAADRIVVNSRFTGGVVREVFGNTGEDVQVVYPCVDTGRRTKDVSVAKVDDGGELWGGLKILLSINRFERKKNIELALHAYHGIAEQDRKGTRLVIAGGYDNRVSENVHYHKELDALATRLGFQTATSKTVVSAMSVPDSINVLFLLSVPSAFKETLLSSSSLLLYTPSYEHFGIVPVEAMYAGLPVLADNTGGPLETIVEGKTGWLRSSKEISGWTEVINYVLHRMSSTERLDMAAFAKQRVEKEFSLHAMGERLQQQIDEMVQAEDRAFLPLTVILGLGLVFGVVSSLLIWLAMS